MCLQLASLPICTLKYISALRLGSKINIRNSFPSACGLNYCASVCGTLQLVPWAATWNHVVLVQAKMWSLFQGFPGCIGAVRRSCGKEADFKIFEAYFYYCRWSWKVRQRLLESGELQSFNLKSLAVLMRAIEHPEGEGSGVINLLQNNLSHWNVRIYVLKWACLLCSVGRKYLVSSVWTGNNDRVMGSGLIGVFVCRFC